MGTIMATTITAHISSSSAADAMQSMVHVGNWTAKAQKRVEASDCILVHCWDDVAVGVHRRGDRVVPKQVLNDLRMHAEDQ